MCDVVVVLRVVERYRLINNGLVWSWWLLLQEDATNLTITGISIQSVGTR